MNKIILWTALSFSANIWAGNGSTVHYGTGNSEPQKISIASSQLNEIRSNLRYDSSITIDGKRLTHATLRGADKRYQLSGQSSYERVTFDIRIR